MRMTFLRKTRTLPKKFLPQTTHMFFFHNFCFLDCQSFVQINGNFSEVFKENARLKTQISKQQGATMTSNGDSYKMHKNPENNITTDHITADFNKVQSRKWPGCYLRRRYLLLLIITLVIGVIVILSLLVDYSQRIQKITKNLRNSATVGGGGSSAGVSGKQSGGENLSPGGCELSEGRRSFPDLDYALFGYNILRGYPLAVGHDPGLTHPIFRHNYNEGRHTADCRYHVPKGYILAPDVSCVTSFASRVVKDNSQFVKSLSVSAEASGGGWGASFSASGEYKKKTSIMSSSESVFIFSQAKCNYYFAMIDEIRPPQFDPSFITMIERLETDKDCYKFFDYYGTHFLKYTLFGAKFVYENKMSKKDYQSESQQSLSVSLKASYSGIFSLNGGIGLTKDQQDIAKKFREKVETSTITIGAPPPEDGKTITWASSVKDNPVPVDYKLDSILSLFTKQYMGNTGLNYQSIRLKLQRAKTSYCSTLLTQGQVNTCKQTLTGYVSFNGLFFGKSSFIVFKSSFDMCTQRCSDNPDCQAASFSEATYNCFLYRATNTSVFKTEESSNVKSVLIKESLKLLDKTLYLENVRLPAEVSRETSTYAVNSTECFQQCQHDSVCFAYSFRRGDLKTNCLLFQEKDITSDSLKFEQGALTAIHINDDNKRF